MPATLYFDMLKNNIEIKSSFNTPLTILRKTFEEFNSLTI